MAGDWLKMRSNLWDDPRVARLCDLTHAREATIIGGLYWLWAAADQHTQDGFMPGLTARQIDRKTGIKGFSAALCKVGWIEPADSGVTIVRFTEHNGTSAKRRAVEAQRKAKARKTSASDADTLRTESGRVAELEKEKEREIEIEEEKREELVPSSPTLPEDGAGAMDIIHRTLAIVSPNLYADDFPVSKWLADINRDPWWVSAAICDMASGEEGAKRCAAARSHRFFTPGLIVRKDSEWNAGGDPKGYVDFAIRSIQKLRGAA